MLMWTVWSLEASTSLCYHSIGDVIMVRTQIQLTEEQAARMKSVAAKKGISKAEFIRQAVDALLAKWADKSDRELRSRALQAAGRFHSGQRDVAGNHDGYLSEDFGR